MIRMLTRDRSGVRLTQEIPMEDETVMLFDWLANGESSALAIAKFQGQ